MVEEGKIAECLAMAIITGRDRVAAVEKVEIFSKFEENLKAADIERMFKRNYPTAILGTLECTGVDGRASGFSGSQYSNLFMEASDRDKKLTGSVVTGMETSKRGGTRIYAFVNIDG